MPCIQIRIKIKSLINIILKEKIDFFNFFYLIISILNNQCTLFKENYIIGPIYKKRI